MTSTPSRVRLLGVAVARGCAHYQSFADPLLVTDEPDLAHELLGCALLAGPSDTETFQSIRVASMVLSDLGNDPGAMRAHAENLGVLVRLAQLAAVALNAGDHPEYWVKVFEEVWLHPPFDDFFPNASRLSLESFGSGRRSRLHRQWLRTAYHAP